MFIRLVPLHGTFLITLFYYVQKPAEGVFHLIQLINHRSNSAVSSKPSVFAYTQIQPFSYIMKKNPIFKKYSVCSSSRDE